MLLRGRSHPRAVHWARGVSCGGCNELVRCRTKRTIRTKGNSLEANVEALLLDDLVRAAILGGSVRVRSKRVLGLPPDADGNGNYAFFDAANYAAILYRVEPNSRLSRG